MTTIPTLHDFVEAYEAYDGDDLDTFLAEWEQRLSAKPDLPEFPVSTFYGSCPSCGASDTIQYLDDNVHFWDLSASDGKRLVFDGSFDYSDGSNDRIECWKCGTAWGVPAGGVDFD